MNNENTNQNASLDKKSIIEFVSNMEKQTIWLVITFVSGTIAASIIYGVTKLMYV